ncbi:mechanosensitive ion channel [Oerskovia turbata]|uniref:Mechanosensitive ion channel n=1 Tax=Oerskovia turbata TaxID=1713 RepID=A0A4Q1KTE3_9CELL|nr:mechanosensitive ion channel [Oerskovia turbata]RXR33292.1 mechanosensitive ion channel [Oerskovia turbata]TGJ96361.1 mechanosensitive ion channel protein MscS [Actinotalea fermentans ATCC 43279 = JCM 9966 = DSM 3133]
MDDEIENATDVALTLAAVAGALVVAFVLGTILSAVVNRLGRRSELARGISKRLRRPDRAVLMVVAVWIAVRVTTDPSVSWRPAVEHALLIALIAAGAWWVGALAFVLEDSALKRFRVDVVDNRHARRIRTQIIVVRRLTVAIIVVCAIAAVLLTFPAARAAGASILASAGVISIVAGLAAQTSLANVFAGMQIAFTDGIRVDDVVVLEGEWGRIEEITMTYVVVHLWDDRRLIMPCTYFTTTPFQNWTRRAADLLGTVELDLDFRVPFGAMRAELKRLLAHTDLWDQRVGILQVTDAINGVVRVRALVSARDAPTLFDLRCFVREGLVEWLQRSSSDSLPRTRFEGVEEGRISEEPDVAPGRSQADGAAAQPAIPEPEVQLPPSIPVGPGIPGQPPLSTRQATRRVSVRDQTRVIGTVSAPQDVVETRVMSPVEAALAGAPGAGDTGEIGPEDLPGGASESAFFSGTAEGVERAQAFAGPGQEVIDEREETAERNRVEDERDAAASQDDADEREQDQDAVRRTADRDRPGDRDLGRGESQGDAGHDGDA